MPSANRCSAASVSESIRRRTFCLSRSRCARTSALRPDPTKSSMVHPRWSSSTSAFDQNRSHHNRWSLTSLYGVAPECNSAFRCAAISIASSRLKGLNARAHRPKSAFAGMLRYLVVSPGRPAASIRLRPSSEGSATSRGLIWHKVEPASNSKEFAAQSAAREKSSSSRAKSPINEVLGLHPHSLGVVRKAHNRFHLIIALPACLLMPSGTAARPWSVRRLSMKSVVPGPGARYSTAWSMYSPKNRFANRASASRGAITTGSNRTRCSLTAWVRTPALPTPMSNIPCLKACPTAGGTSSRRGVNKSVGAQEVGCRNSNSTASGGLGRWAPSV